MRSGAAWAPVPRMRDAADQTCFLGRAVRPAVRRSPRAVGRSGSLLSPVVSTFLTPLLHFFSVLAGIAWIPIATLWFGYGFGAITFVIFNAVFFIVTYNTLLGVSTIPRQTRNAAASLGAGRWAMLTEVLLPGALPNIVTGLRTGLGFAWRRCLPLPWLKAEIQRPECNFLEGTDNQRLQRELGGNIRSLGYRDRIVE